MINSKQLQITVAKVARLKDVYAPFLVKERIPLAVRDKEGPVSSGKEWGEPFTCTDFFATLPAAENVWLECDNGAVENLVFVDGVPVGMTDVVANAREPEFRPHRFVPLGTVKEKSELRVQGYASHPIAGTMPYAATHTFSLRSLEGKRVFRSISLVKLDPALLTFFEDLDVLNGLYRSAEEGDAVKLGAYRVYEKLFSVLPLAPQIKPTEEELFIAHGIIEEYFRSIPSPPKLPSIGLIGHSHLDTAWLWTVDETRRKAVRTLSNAVTLLEKYPDYTFFFSTVLYLDWVKHDSPALFQRVKKLVKEGRLEPNGSTWVECDCNLTGSEALVRQFVRGKRFLWKEFGYDSDTFWLPDTFGYSASLPQIMQGCGVKYFLTTKLSWNDTNEFPYDAFEWEGIDGSRVLVHFNSIQSDASPAFLKKRTDSRKEKHLTGHALVAYGYGDGGGGPSDEMVRVARRTAEVYPYATVKHTTVSSFMHELAADELPRYFGELYLELHRGTLSVHHALKRNNRLLEGLLHDAEYLSVATGNRAWKEKTDACYDTLLLNQFHDILPGTCIGEVNDRSLRETGGAIFALSSLMKGEGETSYFNTLGFSRLDGVEALGEEGWEYRDFDGKIRRRALYSFPPFGKGVPVQSESISLDGDAVRTRFYVARLKEGRICSLTVGGREVAAAPLNTFRISECVPYKWDNWDIDADYPLKEEELSPESVEVITDKGAEVRVRGHYRYGKSILLCDTVFSAYSPEIRFECRLDQRDPHGMLRVLFPTTILSTYVKSAIQFGYLERSTHRSTSQEQAAFETCNHKWSDLSENNFGVALLNDCKYGFAAEGGTMSLTLSKSGTHPDPRGDIGIREFAYALLPHKGGFSAERVVHPAERFNRPPLLTAYSPESPVVSVSAPNIVVETVKWGEDGGIVLRVYECERASTAVKICFNRTYSFTETDLLERSFRKETKGDALFTRFKPFEIKTFLLKEV